MFPRAKVIYSSEGWAKDFVPPFLQRQVDGHAAEEKLALKAQKTTAAALLLSPGREVQYNQGIDSRTLSTPPVSSSKLMSATHKVSAKSALTVYFFAVGAILCS
jgi:hypothetical protein